MIGITSYGAYIPLYRLKRMTIYQALGWLNPASLLPGEKAVANFDEDSITMAVAAAGDCLFGMEREKIDGLFFATTTAPFKERQNAGIVATALDLRADTRTADFGASLKAGTGALLSAHDAISSGSSKNVLVCAADCRLGKPGGYQEEIYGDGAAALLVGKEDIIAAIEGSFSLSYDFCDTWRTTDDRYNRSWEDRWIRDEGYGKFIVEAISGLLKKCQLSPKDITKVAYPCLYAGAHASIGRKLGFAVEQLQNHMFTEIGHTGCAYPLMILVAALEESKPGDRIIVASYGNGSDAILLRVTDNINKLSKERRGIQKHLASKKDMDIYEKYVAFREILDIDTGGRGEEISPTQMTILWRERKWLTALCGSRCKRCGVPQYPPQEICANPDCGAINEMEEYRFSDKKGRLFTYTGDLLAFSPNPPAIYGVVDFEGGGRWLFDLTDCDLESLKVNMPVEMSFRRKFHDASRGIYAYFWKATPIRA